MAVRSILPLPGFFTTNVISCSAEVNRRRRAEVIDRSSSLFLHYSFLWCSFLLSQHNKCWEDQRDVFEASFWQKCAQSSCLRDKMSISEKHGNRLRHFQRKQVSCHVVLVNRWAYILKTLHKHHVLTDTFRQECVHSLTPLLTKAATFPSPIYTWREAHKERRRA